MFYLKSAGLPLLPPIRRAIDTSIAACQIGGFLLMLRLAP